MEKKQRFYGKNGCSNCSGRGFYPGIEQGCSILKKCNCAKTCNKCLNTGYFEVWRDGYRFLKRCSCKDLDQLILRYNAIKIPEALAQKNFQNYHPQTACQRDVLGYVQSYTQAFMTTYRGKKGLILYGDYGVGKSHLLVAVLKSIIFKYDITAQYINFSEWIKELKNSFNKSGKQGDMIQKLTETDILVVDEFSRQLTEYELGVFETIFTERYNKMRPIFLGTTYQLTQSIQKDSPYLGTILPAKVYSRIADFGYFESQKIDGNDYRMK